MRVIFGGTPDIALPAMRALMGGGHEIVGVITREDAPVGRKRVMTPSPVADFAAELGIPVMKANRLDANSEDWVRDLSPDVGVVVAYGGLLKRSMLDVPPLGWVNLHFSLLPEWRGAAPVQRSIMAGDETLGVTVFRLVEELDAGPILTADQTPYSVGTPAGDALKQLAEFSDDALLGALQMLGDDPAAGVVQTGDSSYAKKLQREDGKLNFEDSALRVLNTWAGVTPEPGAWVFDGEDTLKVIDLAMAEDLEGEPLKPGEMQLTKQHVLIGTASGSLRLKRVQPAGKKVMNATDWLRGRKESSFLG